MIKDPKKLLKVIKLQTQVVQLGNDLSAIMNLVIQETQKIVEAQGGSIVILEEGAFVFSAVSGLAEPLIGLRIKNRKSLSALSIERNEILLSHDLENDTRIEHTSMFKSMIAAPLIFEGEPVGVLNFFSNNRNKFSEKTINILSLITELISAAIYRAMHYQADPLFYQATHDALTGISNRALFFDRLRTTVNIGKNNNHHFSVAMIDMDGLKSVNDEYGHRTGDAVLVEVSHRINKLVKPEDTFARLGGDEFAILVQSENPETELPKLLECIKKMFVDPFEFEDNTYKISVSTGYAHFDPVTDTVSTLMDRADRFMYKDKNSKKNNDFINMF